MLASRSEEARGEWEPYQSHMRVELTGSVAYKFALVAAGRHDATFTLTPKNEWDVCAGALLVAEAGGMVTDPDGRAIRFNNRGYAAARADRLERLAAPADPQHHPRRSARRWSSQRGGALGSPRKRTSASSAAGVANIATTRRAGVPVVGDATDT